MEEQSLMAGVKAKEDVRNILKYPVFRCYKKIFKNNILNYLYGIPRFLVHLPSIYSAEKILVQYPFYTNSRFNRICYSFLPVKATVLVHDLNSLRYNLDETEIQKEIQRLNHFQTIIAHTPSMIKWLKQHGLTTNIIELGIFDYITNVEPKYADDDWILPCTVVFAGNLGKSKFLKELLNLESATIQFCLYGPNVPEYLLEESSYRGAFESSELPGILSGNFGLVWDGESLQECQDSSGSYLKYNSPHKFSLYMAAEIPVIVGSQSGLAEFVLQENIGIVLSDLKDLPVKLSRLSEAEYLEMKENTKKISAKVRSGYYIKHALRLEAGE